MSAIRSVIILVINKSLQGKGINWNVFMHGRRILLSLVWLQTELDSTQSYYHYKSEKYITGEFLPWIKSGGRPSDMK